MSFEHARFLHQGSFVMYDRETVSLWIHTTGEAVVGDYQGKILAFLPSTITTWKQWRTEHPQTRVLHVKKGRGARFQLRSRPEQGGLSVGRPDGSLKFFPLTLLQQQRVMQDELAGRRIAVVFDPESFSFAAFETGARAFSWREGKLVDQSGREWDPWQGTSGSDRLAPIPVVPWLTSAWKRFYPDGVIVE